MLELLDRWLEVWEVVRRNRMRTALTMLGVFWGMFMLLLMVGFGGGLERGVRATLGGSATNAVFVWGQGTSLPYKGMQPGRPVDFVNADVPKLRQVRGIEHVAPRSQLGGFRNRAEVSAGSKVGAFQVMGDVPVYRYIQPMRLVAGRFINELDMDQRRKVAVIGAQAAKELYEDRDPMGQTLEINGVWFQVVGVFESPLPGDDGERAESSVHIPFATYQQAFNYGDRISWFAFTAQPDASSAQLELDVRAELARLHAIHPEDEQAMGSYNAEEQFRRVQTTFAGIRFFILGVGGLTLLSGVFGVSNILLVTVRERTQEIGLRRAIGATGGSIIAMILREALVLTSLAGYAGLVCGVAVLAGVAQLVGEDHEVLGNPQVDLNVAVIAAVALVLAAGVAGIVPARRAAAISPVEALRTE